MDTKNKEIIKLALNRMGDVVHDVRNHLSGLDGWTSREDGFENIKKYHGKDRTDKLRIKINELNESYIALYEMVR